MTEKIPMTDLSNTETILKNTYHHFNNRDIDATLAMMQADVEWPNGMEGGVEHDHEAIRNYWTRQRKLLIRMLYRFYLIWKKMERSMLPFTRSCTI